MKKDKNITNKEIQQISRSINVAEELAQLSHEDVKQVADWNKYPNLSRFIYNNKYSEEYISGIEQKSTKTGDSFNRKQLSEDIISKITKRDSMIKRRRIMIISSCAAAILALSAVIYNNTTSPEASYTIAPYVAKNIVMTEPVIVTSSGEHHNLSSLSESSDNKYQIVDNVITYAGKKQAKKSEVEYNELIIPTQKSYRLALSDGSEVVVNGGSRLRYPVSFGDEERRVEVSGEAYFIIKKDSRPFIVNSDDVDLRVYGTEFNVNNRNKKIETVLVKGSLGVQYGSDGAEEILEPNERAIYNPQDSAVVVDVVDVRNHISWVDNYFGFYNESLSDILEELSNWYGVTFHSHKNLKDIKLRMHISRDKPIDVILESISYIVDVEFVEKKGGEYYMK